MLRSLSIAATGMEAQELRIDIISNNLANVNTNGFKKSRADFQDLLYQNLRRPGATSAQGIELPTGLQVGQGTRPVASQRIYTVGDFKQTGNQLDVAIEGDGFFRIQQPNGEIGYTRAGAFKVNSRGQLTTSDGLTLDPAITIPPDATSVSIGQDGTISVGVAGTGQGYEIGQLQLSRFVNPAGLEAIGRNLLIETEASGPPISGTPGEVGSGLGTLAQGYLESSNVKVMEEMVDMIVSQRAYEMNSKVISTADQMLAKATNIK